jgi:cysteine desulfurase
VAHTLAAMHVDHDIANSALRISLSHLTTKEELNTFIEALDLSLSRVKKQR